ncbi:hypothetical protein Pst134EA_029020 [Puccinia striiformis f. sp. tritici]|uniref:hypothetical protein n=1 Tax=Puccinia striiformis f. sp. tritici TaxID=168172 RepID=UPI0020078056|nr:hypothetical protein Pst134EA_029020 [Puccinia striiformis f. sp. tritici]KAH9447035.1 hypothetical protein Pst134EA_029020 [Puccinia striiformis f. sp. tritici]
MTRLSKVKPLVQVTAKQKKKQEKISVRYSRSRAFLTGLMQGNYQLPPITNEPDQPSDQIAHHEQTHYFGEDNNPDDSQTAGPLSIDDLSAWGSIPWNEAATSNIPKPTLSSYLEWSNWVKPLLYVPIRYRDRFQDQSSGMNPPGNGRTPSVFIDSFFEARTERHWASVHV